MGKFPRSRSTHRTAALTPPPRDMSRAMTYSVPAIILGWLSCQYTA